MRLSACGHGLPQVQNVLYYLNSKAHKPPASPCQFMHPDMPPSDMSWAEPMFCDIIVSLPKRELNGKLHFTSVEGCYLGHDFKRGCQHVYLPSLQSILHMPVRAWRRNSFEQCRWITPDTPVQYMDPNDLLYSEVTADYIPKQLKPGRTALSVQPEGPDKEGGVDELVTAVVKERLDQPLDEALKSQDVRDARYSTFEVLLVGREVAKAVAKHSQVVNLSSVAEAEASHTGHRSRWLC